MKTESHGLKIAKITNLKIWSRTKTWNIFTLLWDIILQQENNNLRVLMYLYFTSVNVCTFYLPLLRMLRAIGLHLPCHAHRYFSIPLAEGYCVPLLSSSGAMRLSATVLRLSGLGFSGLVLFSKRVSVSGSFMTNIVVFCYFYGGLNIYISRTKNSSILAPQMEFYMWGYSKYSQLVTLWSVLLLQCSYYTFNSASVVFKIVALQFCWNDSVVKM